MMYRTLGILAGLALFSAAAPALANSSYIAGTLTTGVSTGIEGIVDAAPSATPGAGTYTSAQSVILFAADSDSIRYTIGGSDPNCSTGTLYSGAVSVSASETIRAVACYGGAPSAVATLAYGINLQPAPSGGGSSGGGGGGGGGGSGSYTPPVSTLVGDINHDGKVDILDFSALISAWGQTGSSIPADLNHDGVVDILDFSELLANWTG